MSDLLRSPAVPSDSEAYPLPSYGLAIWLVGDKLNIALPASTPGGKSHVVAIPLTKCSIETTEGGSILGRQRGWLVLLDLLKSKEREKRNPTPKIGQQGSPVRYDIEQMLKTMSPSRYDSKNARIIDYNELDFGDE